jgi:polysaccharide biosynthesis protein PslL
MVLALVCFGFRCGLTHLFCVFIVAWLTHKVIINRLNSGFSYLFIGALFLMGIFNLQTFWNLNSNPLGLNSMLFDGESHFMGLPFNLDILLVTMPIFLLGFMLSKYVLNFTFNKCYFILALGVFAGLHWQFNDSMALHSREYDDALITTLEMITGIYLTFAISSLLSHQKYINQLLAYLGKASLFILIFHFAFQHKFTGVFQFKIPNYPYLIATVALIGSIIYSLIIYEIVSRNEWLNRFFAKAKIK